MENNEDKKSMKLSREQMVYSLSCPNAVVVATVPAPDRVLAPIKGEQTDRDQRYCREMMAAVYPRYALGEGVDGCCRAGCRDVVRSRKDVVVEATNLPRLIIARNLGAAVNFCGESRAQPSSTYSRLASKLQILKLPILS
jgi:hypothetical protein